MKKLSPSSLTSKLASYSAAASMVALGVAKSEAQIIYTDVNPDYAYLTEYEEDYAFIDLNNDGVVDFELNQYFSFSPGSSSAGGSTGWTFTYVQLTPLNGNEIVRYYSTFSSIIFATGFIEGDTINSNHLWTSQTVWPWEEDRFMGVRLNDNGETHYGWLRVSWDGLYNRGAEYAYNTVPDQMILAGDSGCIHPVNSPVISLEGQTLISDLQNGNQWYQNGAAIPGETNSSYTPFEYGSYSILNTDTGGCLTSSPLYSFLDCSKMADNVVSNPNDVNGIICVELDEHEHTSSRLLSNAPYGCSSTWHITRKDDGASYSSGNERLELNWWPSNFYDVITNGAGCSDTSRTFQTFFFTSCPLSFSQTESISVSTFSGGVNFIITDEKLTEGEATFFNALGQEITSAQFINSIFQLDARSLPPGIYFGVFQNSDQRRTVKFLVGAKQ